MSGVRGLIKVLGTLKEYEGFLKIPDPTCILIGINDGGIDISPVGCIVRA